MISPSCLLLGALLVVEANGFTPVRAPITVGKRGRTFGHAESLQRRPRPTQVRRLRGEQEGGQRAAVAEDGEAGEIVSPRWVLFCALDCGLVDRDEHCRGVC